MLCSKSVLYNDLSEMVHVVKAVAIVTSVHLNFSTLLMVRHFFEG